MSLPFNITNPGIYIPGLLASAEANFVADLVSLSYAAGDILYYNAGQLQRLPIGTAGQVLTVTGGLPTWEAAAGGGGGASTFLDLTDTPASYAGQAGKAVRVNGAATALEFVDFPTGTGDVTAASSFGTDNRIIRSDGTGKGVQASAVTLDDTGNISGIGTLNGHTIPGGAGTIALTSDIHAAVTVTDSLTIDFTLTGQNITASVIDNSITFAKMQDIATGHLIGRHTAGSGDPEIVGLDGGIEFSGANIRRSALTGAILASAGSNSTTLGSFTKAELSTAVSDGDVMYVGDAPTAHTHTASDIDSGAAPDGYVLTADGVGGSAWEALPGGGSGDVVGPASATDNALARFDSTTGKLLQDGTLSASDVAAGAVTLSSIGNNDIVLQTGNATTGSIRIVDGANGEININPNGSGPINFGGSAFSGDYILPGVEAYLANSLFLAPGEATLSHFDDGPTGPIVAIFHASASPAANDVVGELRFAGRDSIALFTPYASVKGVILDATNGSEDGKLVFRVTAAGTLGDRLELTDAALYPTTNDGLALGTTTLGWADIYLASGANILVNNSNARRSIVLTAAGLKPTTTAGCAAPEVVEAATNDVDYWVADFDAATNENGFWNIVMPDNYDGGTVTAEFYWTSSAGAAGNVIWGIQGRAFGNDDAIDQAWGTAQEVTDAWIANGDVHISAATGAITIGGSPSGGGYVAFRVYRKASDAGDTLTGDARLLSVKLKYGVSSFSE